MAGVVRLIEVQAESDRNWEDAAAQAVEDLRQQLLKNIDSIRLDDLCAKNGHEEVVRYTVDLKICLSRGRPLPAVSSRSGSVRDRNRRLPR